MSDVRLKKVESLLQKEIGSLIVNGKIKDPRIDTFITVNAVKVSKDTAYAKIYVSSFHGKNEISLSVDALNHASGYIQTLLGRKLRMRLTPKLTFIVDPSIREGFEMIQKIEGLGT